MPENMVVRWQRTVRRARQAPNPERPVIPLADAFGLSDPPQPEMAWRLRLRQTTLG